jgi:hypothetical protein
MSQLQSGSEAAAATLVGSLATFSLVDVLEFLSRTGHTGELQVVGRGVDQRVWMDRGDLVTTGTGSPDAILFDLACIEEGWFYFTASEAAPDGGSRTPVGLALHDVGPQVEEWRSLVAALPFSATVKMSSTTPAAEVQIRADQWQLLSLAGSGGLTVREVLDSSGKHPLDTLRTLRELTDNHLISVDGPTAGALSTATTGISAPESTGPPPAPEVASLPDPPHDAEPTPESKVSPGLATKAPLPPFVPPPPIPPAPEGWVETERPNGSESHEPAASIADGALSDGPGTPFRAKSSEDEAANSPHHSVMPPPINGDPWSSARSAQQPGDESS